MDYLIRKGIDQIQLIQFNADCNFPSLVSIINMSQSTNGDVQMLITSHTLLMAQPVAMLVLFAMAIAPVLVAGNSSSVINVTCTALPQLPYDYCVSVLSADPAAANATDVRGVATGAVNITAHKAASTFQVIAYLIDELNTCRENYGFMEEKLASVLTDFRAGRFDNAAVEKALNATGDPESCDIMLFEGNSHKDPISNENSDNMSWVNLASAILDSIVSKA